MTGPGMRNGKGTKPGRREGKYAEEGCKRRGDEGHIGMGFTVSCLTCNVLYLPTTP